jgi:hypothetical protein
MVTRAEWRHCEAAVMRQEAPGAEIEDGKIAPLAIASVGANELVGGGVEVDILVAP